MPDIHNVNPLNYANMSNSELIHRANAGDERADTELGKRRKHNHALEARQASQRKIVPERASEKAMRLSAERKPQAFTAYSPGGKVVGAGASFALCEEAAQAVNGYVENRDGRVVSGRKPAGKIDLTPTWASLLPVFIMVLEHGTDEGKRIAKLELAQMAKAADLYNASCKD